MTPRLFLAVGLFLCAGISRAQGPEIKDPQPPLGAAVDAQGDPLPPGAKLRLGSTRFRVGGNITAAALSLDGKWIASSSSGDTITLADPKTGKETSRFRLPGGYGASFLTFSPDGKYLAVMGYGPFMQVVEVPSGRAVAKMQPPQPNNYRLSGFAFSGDSKTIIAGTDNFGQNKNFVHAWDVASGKPLHNFEVIQNNQIRGALSGDGSVLATWGFYSPRGGMENNPDQGRTIQLWEVKTGKELRKVKIDRYQVNSVAIAPDGKTFAVASGSATFHLFETDSGKELRRFAGRRGQAQILMFAPDGKTLVAGGNDGTVQLWEAATGKRLGLTEGPRQRLFSIAFPSPGQVWALGLEGQSLSLWNATTGQALSPKDGHLTWVRFLAYEADGKTLMSGGADGKICWWDTVTGKELRHYLIRDEESARYGGYPPGARINTYALSRDGKYLAAANDFGNNSIRLYEMPAGKVLCDFDAARTNNPSGFAFSPDGTRLAAIGMKGVQIWDVTTGVELPSLPYKEDKDNANQNNINNGSLVFSPDGKILAAARSYYDRNTGNPLGDVYLWHVDKGTEIARIERSGYNVGTMAFSPNGQFVAIQLQNQSVMLVKASTGKELSRLEGSQANFIQALAFSPDGRLLAGSQANSYVSSPVGSIAMASAPGSRIVVWELASGAVRQEFSGHQGIVHSLIFAPDGRTLVSGSADTTVLLWDISGKRSDKFSLTAQKLEEAWNDLTAKDGRRAYHDWITGMISTPDLALEVLRKNLQPAKGIKVNPDDVDRLIADLDNDKFSVRIKATSALEQLGDLAGDALRKAQMHQSSLEAQRRLKSLLERLDKTTLPPEEIRYVRAVEIIEKIGTPEARTLLETLASGAAQHRLTMEARAALQRMR